MAGTSAEAVQPSPASLAESAQPRPASILTPIVDFLCVGGLSIIVLVPLLLSGRRDLSFISIVWLAWAQALINYSHFMASYRIIYRSREMVLRHKWASLGVPLILLVVMSVALVAASTTDLLLLLFFAVASGYLAWHYTGQVWGMMASYGYLEGLRYDPVERWLIRGSLRILLAWHLTWFLHFWFSQTPVVSLDLLAATAYQGVSYATVAGFVMGGLGIFRMRLRTGRFPPLRALTAWIAIFVWYAALARWGLPAFFFIQLAHALQYLEFPARVELNRATQATVARKARHMALYGAGLLAASFLVVLAVPGPAMSVVANLLGTEPHKAAPALVLYFINIHHYFTDGVAWKLSNPEVRRELFAHLAPAATPQADRKGKPPKRVQR